MDLFKKYDIAGPRYTSFPPVPFWQDTPKQQQWITHIENTYNPEQGLDIYLHIPYCEKLCWYCGCFRTITKDKAKGDAYSDYLIKEWEIYLKELNQLDLKVHSIHFGGGTPTFLKPETLDSLLQHFASYMQENFLGAMEVDPRTCTLEHLNVLRKYHFKRLSMGIQDFDEGVQKAINREQSFKMVKELVEKVRELEFESINFDLIYGLPRQTKQTIQDTIEKVKLLSPDLIAFYSYAHLPERLKNQRLIKEEELPTGEEKRALYELGRELLLAQDYIEIGLDHFARKDSYLGQAYLQKKMQRSFMGYTDEKTSVLLALGVSAISNTTESFIQNKKDLKDYMELIDQGLLPIEKGHILSSDDKFTGSLINELMCVGEIDLSEIERNKHSEQVWTDLKQMQADGMVTIEDKKLKVTPVGHPFLRNVAMSFDFYLREKRDQVRFSRTI